MSRFLNFAQLEPMWDSSGLPLYNRSSRRLYLLLADFSYQSDIAKQTVVAPKGFVTDLGSVPRVPFIYDTVGEIAIEPYIIHDIAYSKETLPRDMADSVLLEALELVGISWIKRHLIYQGVHLFGGAHYSS